ncbi:MAG: NADH:flavin oxidoreductase/NADH oxidase [Propionibacteriaceae bacterium]|jgi:2,4-dienoyl-CoA reductase-like NADH-dependent reductase (Old Yellow Enzyme family)|nr:NADH:flavin oxidoreductase/NADH oxidase [Propionibacteriaceae bacterium]
MIHLFEPLTLRSVTFRNRVWLPPMCTYQVDAHDGRATDWHLVHYGARATGGFGLLIVEATAVVPEGRITMNDLGLWDDAQVEGFARLTAFAHHYNAAVGVQLAHAGRKASTWPDVPRFPDGYQSPADGGWEPVGPGADPFPGLGQPRALTTEEVAAIPARFADAARRADAAGLDVVELHGAHGYLQTQFLSPLTNHRTDQYGGSFENRTRLLRETVEAVRAVWPESKPLFLRISATEWTEGGWTVEDSVALAEQVKPLGVDLVDVSSGGNVLADIPVAPGYHVTLAQAVRQGAGLPVAAVGLITEPAQAEQVLVTGQADAVLIGRAALRDPDWPETAAVALGAPSPLAESYRRGSLKR